jgi:hypothetical protein
MEFPNTNAAQGSKRKEWAKPELKVLNADIHSGESPLFHESMSPGLSTSYIS